MASGLMVQNHIINYYLLIALCYWLLESSLTYWEKLLDEYLIILYRSHFLEHTNFWWSGSNVVG